MAIIEKYFANIPDVLVVVVFSPPDDVEIDM